jgi:hypothetical protein
MKLKIRPLFAIVAFGCVANAFGAPNTLRGGSDYENRLEQAGMSGMSGMSGSPGTTAGEPAKKKSNKKAVKNATKQPAKQPEANKTSR